MNFTPAALLDWVPAFTLVLARIGAAMALLPGVGEAVAPASVRIGLALSLTILVVPEIQLMVPPVPEASVTMGLMIAGEVVTGLWFGWIARMIVLALPIGAQFIGFLVGLSSVLQPDPELGAQSGALGKLFEVAAPVLLLVSGMYRLPLLALVGLIGALRRRQHVPRRNQVEHAIAWHLGMGLISRIISRMQIYFVSMPGQIVLGLGLLTITAAAMTLAWRDGANAFLGALPGGG